MLEDLYEWTVEPDWLVWLPGLVWESTWPAAPPVRKVTKS
jgi:hypothetical protein